MNGFAVLTPYLIPSSLPQKKINIGDGFILKAIERRLGQFSASRILTSRVPPGPAEMEELRGAGIIILGGANQLNDNFSVWPGATAETIRRSGLVFVPFGIGLHGEAEKNAGFSQETLEVIEALHERIEYSSWRCGRTIALLEKFLPHLKGRFLMTSCPVLFDEPLLNSSRFLDRDASVAVTVTERGDFWERESSVIRFVASAFPRAKKTLVLHQLYEPVSRFEERCKAWPLAHLLLTKRQRLRNLAWKLGYEIVAPASAASCISLYESIDIHFGSRLHAHLLFLSRNKRSFLVPVDERSRGFAESLDFPLLDYRDMGRHLNFNFETVRENARRTFETMSMFVSATTRLGRL